MTVIANSKLDSAFVALFWFEEDYSNVKESVGKVEFTQGDVVGGNVVLPKGSHQTYKGARYRDYPRGRIEVENGYIKITVGVECPDSAIWLVKKQYSLNKYNDRIRVVRAEYWDKVLGTG